ncbi:MAG: hypothetical protein U0167_07105 [bacterium]
MTSPQIVQYRNVASKEEADLLERILRVKDAILKLTPGFAEEADELRQSLRPHNEQIYLRPDVNAG